LAYFAHNTLRKGPLHPARPQTNTFSICLDHGIALAQSSPSTTKRHCGICTSQARDDLTLPDHQEYWPEFQAELASHGRYLPAYVTKEFDEYLKCGILEHGFLRVRCEACHDEKLLGFSCKKRGFCCSCGARRMVDSAALLVD
jgi:hypothetical protein